MTAYADNAKLIFLRRRYFIKNAQFCRNYALLTHSRNFLGVIPYILVNA